MKLRYRYRVYPTRSQELILARCFGVSRFSYNWALNERTQSYKQDGKSLGYIESSARMTQFKKQEEFSWLNDVSFDVIQQSLRDLQASFKNFFNKTSRYPKFKSKNRSRDSARFTRNSMWIEERGVRLTKVGTLKTKWHRQLPSHPSSCTITRERSGKYFASFVVEEEREPFAQTNREIGIDFGISTLMTLSDGEKISNPKFLKKSLKRVKTLNQQLSRKRKASKRRAIAKKKLARAHEKVRNQRLDHAHKLTKKLITENDIIHIEDLDLKQMTKNHGHNFNRNLADTSIGQMTRLLIEKAQMYGREVKKINRYYPSSQICSNCGYRNQSLKLSEREWTCESCKTHHDRDLNAAKNILAVGHTVFAH